ncbi:hypothetical protein M2262_002469 [Pseudomonas sp. BIGb0408]|uniref:Uncharacterized protein n=1 Tax=Phytopseudomonas flavescens TaxID=29435 RepID=A0A7Z0BNL9_9GAMM|nr:MULTISPECIES: hypothetical protein [Pseudomonas]MCW2292419.1 hypothetical protein [Pseudomonas sp. BIGb0408]NYH73010.1 hypothetical protein [Pseudomonas flavescens]
MNNEHMQEFWAKHRVQVLAKALSITPEDVDMWVISDYPENQDGGSGYGHIVEFSDDAPPALLERVGGSPVRIESLAYNQGLEGA